MVICVERAVCPCKFAACSMSCIGDLILLLIIVAPKLVHVELSARASLPVRHNAQLCTRLHMPLQVLDLNSGDMASLPVELLLLSRLRLLDLAGCWVRSNTCNRHAV